MEHQYGLYGLFLRPVLIIASDFVFMFLFGFLFAVVFGFRVPPPRVLLNTFAISKTPIGLWVDLL